MLSSQRPVTKTPHDALFKSVLQQPETAAAELQHVLSAEHVSAVDWSTLALESGSFVDEGFTNEHSDLLVSAKARVSGERVLVYLLFGHQSMEEPKMAPRLLTSPRATTGRDGSRTYGGRWRVERCLHHSTVRQLRERLFDPATPVAWLRVLPLAFQGGTKRPARECDADAHSDLRRNAPVAAHDPQLRTLWRDVHDLGLPRHVVRILTGRDDRDVRATVIARSRPFSAADPPFDALRQRASV